MQKTQFLKCLNSMSGDSSLDDTHDQWGVLRSFAQVKLQFRCVIYIFCFLRSYALPTVKKFALIRKLWERSLALLPHATLTLVQKTSHRSLKGGNGR